MGRRVQFIVHVPKGMRVNDVNKIDNRIIIDVREGIRRIDRLDLATAKKKYG